MYSDPAVKGGHKLSLDMCRLLDIVIALAVLLFIAPLMLVIAGLIKLQDGGPALFRQSRIGQGGEAFKCLKFRTMVTDAEVRLNALLARDPEARREWELDHKLRKDPRITALGAFLRKSSLDELPQLFNVLKGEMSLVGPRPIVTAEIPRYGRWFAHYCAVRPGVTGLWQVNGRNDVSYRRRVALDVLYARTVGVRRYVQIMAATVPAVLLRSGSY
ncbi:sugar transferase [Phenylobacterium sp.]|uniref:sugar transferase n=1 Tax=Phenylobacterium sp. TaxID=1871053 RepID=UPI00300386BA